MIDRNEAFRHNSCKKLAQLGKVIFTLSAAAREKEDEKAEIVSIYEDSILQIFDNHKKQREEIHTSLVRYRKACIEKYCNNYGNFYKRLKSDYSDVLNTKTGELNSIMDEMKKAKADIAKFQSDIKQSSQNCAMSADAMFSEINSPHRKSKKITKSEIDRATKEFTDKIQEALALFEQTIKSINSQHKKSKSQIRLEISKMSAKAVGGRIDVFKSYKQQISSLVSQVKELKQKYLTLAAEHHSQTRNAAESKKEFIKQIKEATREARQKVVAMSSQIKTDMQKFQTELSSNEAELEARRSGWRSQVAELDKKIEEMKQKSSKVNMTDSRNRNAAIASIMESYMKEFEEEKRRLKEKQAKTDHEIKLANDDIASLYIYTKESTTSNLEDLATKSAAMQVRIANAYKHREGKLAKEREKIEELLNQRVKVLEASIEVAKKKKENSHKTEKEELAKTKALLDNVSKENEGERKKAEGSLTTEVEFYENSLKARKNRRRAELENALNRKRAEKQKKVDELKDKFDNELKQKTSQMTEESKKQLIEVREEFEAKKTEVEEFEAKKSKLIANSQFISTQIQAKKTETEKAIERFNNELASIDKLKRQLIRRIETETRGIDDEYEMKIQVEQVDLQKSIENISKLYDEDENQRGRSVIEMIRKVRETKNRVDDFLKRKRKELENLSKENNKVESELKAQIDVITSQSKENEIQTELHQLTQSTAMEIKQIENEQEKRISVIQTLVDQLKQETEETVADLQKETRERMKDIQIQIDETESEIRDVERIKQEKMAKIVCDMNIKEEEIVRKGGSDIDKMKYRIEMAMTRKQEMIDEMTSIYDKQKQDFNQTVADGVNTVWNRVQKSLLQSKTKSDNLDAKIEELWEIRTDVEKQTADILPNSEDQARIDALQTKIASDAADIKVKMDSIVSLLVNGPDESLLIQPIRVRLPSRGSISKLEKLAPLQAPNE